MRAASHHGATCAECGHPLATDQRYCVACGARRGALPTDVAVALGELAARPTSTPAATPTPVPVTSAGGAEPPPQRHSPLAPVAGALAVCVLLMLGVGSLIGAASTPGGVTSLANTIVVALSPTAHAPTRLADTGPAPGGGGGGGGGGGAAASGGGGSGGGAAAAPQAARTVTISATGGTGTGSSATSPTTPATTPAATLPPIHHVWEIVLSDQGYQQSFATPVGHPYLSRTLADQGTLLSDYDSVTTSPLANEIALISGQGPTAQTLQDCPQYADIVPGRIAAHAQALGQGCLYPAGTETIGSELQIAGLRWRAYIQGIGDAGQRHPATTTSSSSTTTSAPTATSTTSSTPTTGSSTTSSTTSSSASGSSAATAVSDTSTASGCPHPAPGATDGAQQVATGDGYVTWKNPWVYFHSVIGATTCTGDDTGIGQLARDLRRERTTPAFSYIAPDPCDDGSDTPCMTGARAGLGQADTFLKGVVPEIERSPAYKANGLILITFDEAPQSGPNWSTASCCGEPTYPNLRGSGVATTSGTTSSTATTSSTTTSAPPTTATTTSTATTTTSGATGTASATTTTSCSSTATTPTTPTSTTPTVPTTATGTTTSTTGSGSPCAPTTTGDPPGGGQVGLLMISPYVARDTINEVSVYNHFSLLKSVSEMLGVTPLGYADLPQVPALSPSLFQTTRR